MVQAKLLRAIDGKAVYRLGSDREAPLDVRILAATNHDLVVHRIAVKNQGNGPGQCSLPCARQTKKEVAHERDAQNEKPINWPLTGAGIKPHVEKFTSKHGPRTKCRPA